MMSSRTLSSEMISQWTDQDVANWFSENGFGCAKRYIKQHKINGQKLLLNSSQPQKEMFGMNEKRTRELLTKLNIIGIYNNFPSDDSFDEIYESSEGEDGGTDLTKISQQDRCGYLNPDQYESQTDLSISEFTPSTPPELPPRTAPFGKMACEVLDNVPREVNSRESKKVKINEDSAIPPAAHKPFSNFLTLSEEDSEDEGSGYEPVDEVTDIIKPSVLKFSMQQNDPLPSQSAGWQPRTPVPPVPKFSPPKHESDIRCKPSPNLPLSSPKHMSHQFQSQPPKLPPPRKDSAIKEDESDGLEYEIGIDCCKLPSPPPRPKAVDPGFKAADPEWQTNARFPQGAAPSLPSDRSPELITPKFRHPCVPGMLKIEIGDITQTRSQLKPRNKEEVAISEKASCLKSPGPNILKPTKMPTLATEEPMANGLVERTPVSRPLPEKPSSGKKVVLPPKNIPILQTNPISISLEDEKWYHKIGRPEANSILEAISKNGAFVVRPSSRDPLKPYVLAVYLDGEIKNIPIRKRSDKKFALGKEKTNEEAFESIGKLVAHHFKKKIDILTKDGVSGVTLVNAHSLNK